MRMFKLALVAGLLLIGLQQVGAVELLTNGGFEQATPPNNYGPGWSGDQGFTVIGPQAWFWGVQPQSGQRAIGVASNTGEAGARLGNSSNVPSGYYKLTITGWVWLNDTFGGDGYHSWIQVKVWVDDKIIRAQTFRTDFTTQNTWIPVRFEWRGYINSKVSMELFARADGRGPSYSWGVVCSDSWSIDAELNPPPVPNLLTNGGFEQSYPGTNNPGPGWTSNGLPISVGWEWFPYYYGIWNIEYIKPNPYNEDKAMHVGYNCWGTGSLEQTVPLAAGNYVITFIGHVVVYDNESDTSKEPYCDVQYRVDGLPVFTKRIWFEQNEYQGESWKEIRYTYQGSVNNDVGVWINAYAPIDWDDVIIDEFQIIASDNTPPTTPIVTDEGVYQEDTTKLSASWVSSDPESGIVEYQYAVGSAPGLADVAGWVSVGINTSGTRYGLSLQPGQTYYINVKAKNNAGVWSAIGSSDGITITHQVATIGQAKLLPDGTPVSLRDKFCTENKGFVPGEPVTPGTDLWIEEADRSSAIHIPTVTVVDRGGKVAVSGKMGTANGERIITEAVVNFLQHGTPETQIKPIGLNNLALGANNIAMLVSVWGNVTQRGTDYFYIDDGTGRRDGTQTNGEDNVGIRILAPSDFYAEGTMLRVEGIVETFESGGEYYLAIRPLIDDVGGWPTYRIRDYQGW